MLVNGKHLEAGNGVYGRNTALRCSCLSNGTLHVWDGFFPLIEGKKIEEFSVTRKSSYLRIGKTEIIIPEASAYRQWYIEPHNAEVGDDQSLEDMWIVTKTPYIDI